MNELEAAPIAMTDRAIPSPDALGEFARTNRDRAYSIALRITRSTADAEDAVQDAALKLLNMRQQIQTLDACEGLFYRQVIQCSLDALKKDQRRSRREALSCEGAAEMRTHESAGAEAERGELLALLRQAVEGLPEDERLAVSLCFEGLSVVDTAKSLDVPRETVRSRLQRAIGRLRGFMTSRGHAVGVTLALGLMWRDGSHTATSALIDKLDAVLPGRPCSQIAVVSSRAPIDAAEFMPRIAPLKTWAAALAAGVVAAWFCGWYVPGRLAQLFDSDSAKLRRQSVVSSPNESSKQSAAPINAKAAAGASETPGSAPTSLPAKSENATTAAKVDGKNDDELAAAIRSIESRNAAKMEARARQIEAQVRVERAEVEFNWESGVGSRQRQTRQTVPPGGTLR